MYEICLAKIKLPTWVTIFGFYISYAQCGCELSCFLLKCYPLKLPPKLYITN